MEKGLEEKTGKPLVHWLKVVQKSGLEKHKQIIDHLKSEHGFTHGFANFVALKARKADAGSSEAVDLVENQYRGKEALKPLYEKLLEEIGRFGTDITTTAKKDSVSLIRKRQFALIKPATKTRIDLGLKIKGRDTEGRLEASGPFGAMCTHRIRLEKLADIDADVLAWLLEAYEANA